MIMNALNGVKCFKSLKADKDFEAKLNFKGTKFSVKIRDIHKIEIISISAFGYENKKKYPIYVSKNALKKNTIYCSQEKKRKGTTFLSKDFNTFMYDHKLQRGRKHFCRHCLQAFSSGKYENAILKIFLKLMVNKGLICLKKEYVRLKIMKEK